MFPKYLTDAKIRATLYMSKIVFFTLFLTRFHLGGVLGFWELNIITIISNYCYLSNFSYLVVLTLSQIRKIYFRHEGFIRFDTMIIRLMDPINLVSQKVSDS